jgi:hypothetical protein
MDQHERADMENEAVRPEETPGPTFAIVEGEELKSLVMGAFKSLGTTMLAMRTEMEAQRNTLTRVLEERAEIVDLVTRLSGQVQAFAEQTRTIHDLGELVRAMDLRIRTLAGLIDSHQSVLIAAGLAKPRPEDPVVN